MKAIEIAHDTEWYAVEENYIYVSHFYWDDGVKELLQGNVSLMKIM